MAMTTEERQRAVDSLKEICREIGCTKMSVYMCDERPHLCSIIRRLVSPSPSDNTTRTEESHEA
jgi:hypothetical protein